MSEQEFHDSYGLRILSRAFCHEYIAENGVDIRMIIFELQRMFPSELVEKQMAVDSIPGSTVAQWWEATAKQREAGERAKDLWCEVMDKSFGDILPKKGKTRR